MKESALKSSELCKREALLLLEGYESTKQDGIWLQFVSVHPAVS